MLPNSSLRFTVPFFYQFLLGKNNVIVLFTWCTYVASSWKVGICGGSSWWHPAGVCTAAAVAGSACPGSGRPPATSARTKPAHPTTALHHPHRGSRLRNLHRHRSGTRTPSRTAPAISPAQTCVATIYCEYSKQCEPAFPPRRTGRVRLLLKGAIRRLTAA